MAQSAASGGAAPAPTVVAGDGGPGYDPQVALAAAQAQARLAQERLDDEAAYVEEHGQRPPEGWHTARWLARQAEQAVTDAEQGLEFAQAHAAGIIAGHEQALGNARDALEQCRAELRRVEGGGGR